ncbi:MAG: hypothetical protein ACPF9D_11635 [Owenweeksia sp.]
MKKLRFLAFLFLLFGIAACSKEEDKPVVVTHTPASLLCMAPWDYNHISWVKTLNDKVVEEYEGPAWGRIDFKPGYLAILDEPGKTSSALSWKIESDSLFIGNNGYAITDLTGFRLELQHTTRRLTDKGIEIKRTQTIMTR